MENKSRSESNYNFLIFSSSLVLFLWSLYSYAGEIYSMLSWTFWLALAALISITFPLYANRFGKYAVSIAFALGYFCHLLGLNVGWIAVFSSIVFFVPEEKKVEIDSALLATSLTGDSLVRTNKWINLVLQKIVFNLTGFKFEHFDVGLSVPSIRCLYLEEKLVNDNCKQNGFEMILAYSYETDGTTGVAFTLPATLPVYGEVKIPISIAAPCIKGITRVEGLFEECTYNELDFNGTDWVQHKREERFFALCVAFDQIEKITVGEIQVMNASKLEWVLSLEIIKSRVDTLINSLIGTTDVHIILFDKYFTFVGIAKKPRYRPIEIQPNSKSDGGDRWKLQDLVDEMKICSKCKMKFLPVFLGCCCELSALPFGTITLNRSADEKRSKEDASSTKHAPSRSSEGKDKNYPRTIAPTLATPSSPHAPVSSTSLNSSSASIPTSQQIRNNNSNNAHAGTTTASATTSKYGTSNTLSVGSSKDREKAGSKSHSSSSSISSSDPFSQYEQHVPPSSTAHASQLRSGLLSSASSSSPVIVQHHPEQVILISSTTTVDPILTALPSSKSVSSPSLGDSNSKKRSFLNSPPPEAAPIQIETMNDKRLQHQQQMLLQQQSHIEQQKLQKLLDEKMKVEQELERKKQHQQAQSVQPASNATVSSTFDFFGFGAEKKEKFPSLSFKNSI